MTDEDRKLNDLIKEKVLSAEGRRELADMMVAPIRKRMAERRAQHLANAALSPCVRVYHPFLGEYPFKDTCPVCGYTVKKDSAR